MLKKIQQIAIEAHQNVNHKYDEYPYSYHLNMVVNEAKIISYLIPKEAQLDVICACWLHDTIEDCRLTYNDIIKVSNIRIANVVYAVTNEKGKNRGERANEKYYQGIREIEYASFVKLCDRIANVKHSKITKSRMFELYKNEQKYFYYCLFRNEPLENTFDIKALEILNNLFLE